MFGDQLDRIDAKCHVGQKPQIAIDAIAKKMNTLKHNEKDMEALKNDEELQQLRQEWKRKFTEPFIPWNYDCFGGIEDYKQRIRNALECGTSRRYVKVAHLKRVKKIP